MITEKVKNTDYRKAGHIKMVISEVVLYKEYPRLRAHSFYSFPVGPFVIGDVQGKIMSLFCRGGLLLNIWQNLLQTVTIKHLINSPIIRNL